MSDNIVFSKSGISPLLFLKNFIELELSSYNWSQASEELITTIPTIYYENPFSIYKNASSTMAYGSMTFPSIGIELIKREINKEHKKEDRLIEITDTFLTEQSSYTFLERLNLGYLLTDDQITSLNTALSLYQEEDANYLCTYSRYKMNEDILFTLSCTSSSERFYFEPILSKSLAYAKEELKNLGIPSEIKNCAFSSSYDTDHVLYSINWNIHLLNEYSLYVCPSEVELEANKLKDYSYSDLTFTTMS